MAIIRMLDIWTRDLILKAYIDFAVNGLGQFENITHAKAKNVVGSTIEIGDGFDANIWEQGKKIGKKSVWQKILVK